MFSNKLNNFKINHNTVVNHCSDEKKLFLVISLLHINGFINNDSIKSLFKNLREGKLNRRINTYYSKITKEWYDYERIYNIYNDIFSNLTNPKSASVILRLERINKLRKINGLEPKIYKTYLSFEETLKYLNLFLNKNRNFCIDHLYYEYISPSIKETIYSFRSINEMFEYDFSYLENKNSYGEGEYCCSDCCGDYDDWYEYIRSRKNDHMKIDIAELISEFLNDKRTKYKGSYKKFVI
jgi:hypothetical protein